MTEYEKYIVGCLLHDDPEATTDIFSEVTEADFSDRSAKAIFCAVRELKTDGAAVDPVSVHDRAKLDGIEISVSFLNECVNVTPTLTNAAEYAKGLHEYAERMRLSAHFYEISQELDAGSIEIEEGVSKGRKAISEVCVSSRDVVTGSAALDDALKDLEDRATGRKKAISSGFPSLDKYFDGGFQKGGLYIVGARPAQGKTTLALSMANNIALNNNRVLYVSMEMTRVQMTQLRLQMTGRIPAQDLTNIKCREVQEKLEAATTTIRQYPIDFNDRSNIPVSYIGRMCAARYDAVIIDYLQLIKPSTGKTRYEQITNISRDLKLLALEKNIPVICLSQLRRNENHDVEKEPRLDDLRDSGSIEQDADAVLLLHLTDRAEAGSNEPSELKVRIAKNRYGEQGSVVLDWYMKTRIIRDRKY